MVRYTPASQLSLEGFEHPFLDSLDPENRWIKLSALLPWDELASVYARGLRHDSGRQTVDIRLVIGSLVIKHRLKLSDRETVDMIAENVYMQYFCGIRSFSTRKPFDASLFVDIRKRMGADKFDAFNDLVIARSESLRPTRGRVMHKPDAPGGKDTPEGGSRAAADGPRGTEQPANKGVLKVDATVSDQQVLYPTDLGLLNRCREESERLIDLLCRKLELQTKPRTYRRKARGAYLAIAKRKRKDGRTIRRGIGQQLRYLKRNLGHLERLLDRSGGLRFPLAPREQRIYWVIQHIHAQQQEMHATRVKSHPHRIVNIYQPHVRPIVRGKDKTNVEFGAKINISEYGGMSKIDTIGWEAYNESTGLPEQVERYRRLFGRYPERLLADSIYLTRENRKYLKEKGIQTVGVPLGRPRKEPMTPYQKRKLKKQRNLRNLVEGKIGQGKNGYALGNIRARRMDTSESWIAAIFFVMNLVTLTKLAEKYFLVLYPILRSIRAWHNGLNRAYQGTTDHLVAT